MRKKYSTHIEVGPRQDEPPVMSPPAAEPPPAVETKPVEPMVESSPAEEAAQNALRQRLKEMESAEALQRQQQQPPQHAEEPQAQEPQPQEQPTLEQLIANLPPRIQRWYRAHPEFLTDPEKAAQIQYCHHVARRETGEEMTEPYYDRMEQMLGLRQHTQSNGNGRTDVPKQNIPPAAPRPSVPPQRMAGPAVSAPPSRDVPSYSTGRSPRHRAPLTRDELEIAAASGMTAEQYQAQKERMLRMKAAGEIQNG